HHEGVRRLQTGRYKTDEDEWNWMLQFSRWALLLEASAANDAGGTTLSEALCWMPDPDDDVGRELCLIALRSLVRLKALCVKRVAGKKKPTLMRGNEEAWNRALTTEWDWLEANLTTSEAK